MNLCSCKHIFVQLKILQKQQHDHTKEPKILSPDALSELKVCQNAFAIGAQPRTLLRKLHYTISKQSRRYTRACQVERLWPTWRTMSVRVDTTYTPSVGRAAGHNIARWAPIVTLTYLKRGKACTVYLREWLALTIQLRTRQTSILALLYGWGYYFKLGPYIQMINTAARLVRAHLDFFTSWGQTVIFAVLKAWLMSLLHCDVIVIQFWFIFA